MHYFCVCARAKCQISVIMKHMHVRVCACIYSSDVYTMTPTYL